MNVVIHWFRADLRLRDNTALHAACAAADVVIPLFIFDPLILRAPDNGAPITGFMLELLASLEADIERAGARLVYRQGEVLEEMKAVFREAKAQALFYNRDYEPYARERDATVEKWAREAGIEVHSFKDSVLHEPHEVLKDDGKPYGVFTPYARKWRQRPLDPPQPVAKFPRRAKAPAVRGLRRPKLKELGFSLEIKLPPAGEKAAAALLDRFARGPLRTYATDRNLPAHPGTSQLSPYLRMGAISVRTVAAVVGRAVKNDAPAKPHAATYLGELAWRDFYRQILWHSPNAAKEALKPACRAIRWPNDETLFKAWCEGRTGFPMVDAGMRQMNSTGWMHNRVRMIAGSFLCKDLLVSWQWGERYFMQRLLDADLANNNGGWQWCAGTGTDAQPYFRIFNPQAQEKKFDPGRDYVRHWIPEMDTPEYPKPVVQHAVQRIKALALYRQN